VFSGIIFINELFLSVLQIFTQQSQPEHQPEQRYCGGAAGKDLSD